MLGLGRLSNLGGTARHLVIEPEVGTQWRDQHRLENDWLTVPTGTESNRWLRRGHVPVSSAVRYS